jgi:hypothetical protein
MKYIVIDIVIDIVMGYGEMNFIIGYITGKVVLDIILRFYIVDNFGTD